MGEPIDPNAVGDYQPPRDPVEPPNPYQQPGYQPQYQQPQYGQPQYQQPQYQQPQYGQPSGYVASYPEGQYPPPGYPQPQAGYPQAGYPQAGYPQQGYPPYAAPLVQTEPVKSRRRLILIIAAIVVVVGVAVGVVVTLGSSSKKSPTAVTTLSMPSTLGPYDQITDAAADQVRSSLQSVYGTSGSLGQLFTKATLGIYGTGGSDTPKLVVVAAPTSQFPQMTPGSLSGSGLGGVGAFETYPPGPHGGALSCTHVSLGQISEAVCLWSDTKTIGFVTAVNTGLGQAKLAALVNEARDSLDH